MSRIILDCSSTFANGAGFLNQTQSLHRWLVLPAGIFPDPLSPPSEAEVSGRLLCLAFQCNSEPQTP